jgi:predicted RNase H-like HicB family nuclease
MRKSKTSKIAPIDERAGLRGYPCQVEWSDEDREFVGLCAAFPSISWLAPTRNLALAGIRKVVREVVLDLRNNGEPVPQLPNN